MHHVERFIALRYLKPQTQNLFVSIIGVISIVGVTVGVAAIVFVLSMLNGFEREVRSRFVGFDAHMKIRRADGQPIRDADALDRKIRSQPGVVVTSPTILEKAMISSAYGSHVAFVKGTTETGISGVTELPANLVGGTIDFGPQSETMDGVLIGYSLGVQLDLDEGDTLTVISPAGVTSPFSQPIAKKFIVTGSFKTDMFEYDNAFAFISLDNARRLFEIDKGIQGFDVKVTDLDQAIHAGRELRAALGPEYVVETWQDLHADLYRAMAMEKWGSLVLLSLIIMVAGFNIVSTLIMGVMQKTAEIGILKALGASSGLVSRIFVQQGLVVGVIGIVGGCLLGYGVCFLQVGFGIIPLPSDIFFLDTLPMEIQPLDFLAVVVVAFALCLASTLYPARKAADLLPIEALRSV